MKVEKAVANIKTATHDISDEYSTDECIGFLNTAVQQISHLLIAAKSPQMVMEIKIHNLEDLPEDFVKPAGTYPIKITGQKMAFLDEEMDEIRFRYFATKKQIEDIVEDMPFRHEQLNDVAVKSAVLLALNQNEYDISQDKALVDEIKQVIAQGMADT